MLLQFVVDPLSRHDCGPEVFVLLDGSDPIGIVFQPIGRLFVQMGEVIWNSHEYIPDPYEEYETVTVVREREAEKCRRSIQDLAGQLRGGANSNEINKLFSAVYEDKVEAFEHVEEIQVPYEIGIEVAHEVFEDIPEVIVHEVSYTVEV